ncbi:MAG: phosphoribosylamine--glycine ligase [Balneolales bacterium]
MNTEINVLLIGSGGREHALAWGIHKSKKIDQLYIAPGNPGTALCGTNVKLDVTRFQDIAEFIEENNVQLTVIGPEQPLVDGITDYLTERGHKVFGPSAAAAQLEGSKTFAKEIMHKYGIPTAKYERFTFAEQDQAEKYIKDSTTWPLVLKSDGLAGGKGVFICEDENDAIVRLYSMINDPAMNASGRLIIEEFMEGEEASVFAVTDGRQAKILQPAQDHKRIGEGDTGLNTGGMGAYAPAPIINGPLLKEVEDKVIHRILGGMQVEGMPYRGVLYIGLMITKDGPKVVEFNCRFGDPECQVLIPGLKSDLLELLLAAVDHKLDETDVVLSEDYHCCVVISSKGYPKAHEKGKKITGLNNLSDNVIVFHSGTKEVDGDILTSGGRVLSVTGSGSSLDKAIENTYSEVKKIHFDNAYYRTDIGKKGLKIETRGYPPHD